MADFEPLPRTAAGQRSAGPHDSGRLAAAGGRLGPYEVLAEIGRGGMGVVYRARHAALGRIVALKVIRPGREAPAGSMTDDEAVTRFEREARAAAMLAGLPGIVGVHDIGEERDPDGRRTLWFAMDLIEGGSLERLIVEGELPHRRAAELVAGAARAIHEAHVRGFLHRDVKPGNILLDGEGRPLVTDFGLVTARDAGGTNLTRTGMVLGTPAYMPPEQARGQGLDVRADVYALGATLYEALTFQPPFAGSAVYDVIPRVVRDEPRPPRALVPGLPRDLETITLKCLEKVPERRYASAAALADELERWGRGEPIAARRVGPLARVARRVARHPLPFAVAGGAAALVAGLLGVLAWREARARAAIGEDVRLATALTASDPEQALGVLARVAQREPDHPGLAEARAAAEARRAALARDAVERRAATLLAVGREAAEAWRAAEAAIAALESGGIGSPIGPLSGPVDPAAPRLLGGADPGAERPLGLTSPATDARVAELADARRARDDAYASARTAFAGVLAAVAGAPDSAAEREARAALGALALARLRAAEAADDAATARRALADLAAHAGPAHAAVLAGAATVTLDTTPTGARVTAVALVDQGGRFLEGPRRALGVTPLAAAPLPAGNWLLLLERDGAPPARYPVRLARGEDHAARDPIAVPTAAQIGAGFVYVPAGEAVLGGDPLAYQSWPPHREWVDGFCIGAREVSLGEYRAFLEARLADGESDDALRPLLPASVDVAGGRVRVGDRARDDWNVFGVTWAAAVAYADWRSAIEGRPVRLPTEREWERAARGADGRRYPWGNGFDWEWVIGAGKPAWEGRGEAALQGRGAADVSVFGVRDLAGNVREWCQEVALRDTWRAVRGGDWDDIDTAYYRAARRWGTRRDAADATIGFRVVADLRP